MSTIAPISNAPSPDKPARPSVRDCLALWILKLAKMRRGRLSSAAAEDCADFYEKFFEEKDLDAYEKDARMALRRDTIRNALLKHSPPPGRVLDIGCGLGDVLG